MRKFARATRQCGTRALWEHPARTPCVSVHPLERVSLGFRWGSAIPAYFETMFLDMNMFDIVSLSDECSDIANTMTKLFDVHTLTDKTLAHCIDWCLGGVLRPNRLHRFDILVGQKSIHRFLSMFMCMIQIATATCWGKEPHPVVTKKGFTCTSFVPRIA